MVKNSSRISALALRARARRTKISDAETAGASPKADRVARQYAEAVLGLVARQPHTETKPAPAGTAEKK